MSAKAIFLDSDGVLNTTIIKDGKPAAPTTLAELTIPAEVKPALDRLKTAGYLLICVTNKPDIALNNFSRIAMMLIIVCSIWRNHE